MLSHKLRRYKAPAVSNTDANFKQVSLLLHGDGTNGAQNNTFLDSSTNNFTVTRNGNTTQGTNTPFSQAAGYWSNYFNGSVNYLTTPSINLATNDFTWETWVYRTNTVADDYILVGGSGALVVSFSSSGTSVDVSLRNVGYIAQITTTIPLNQWFHIAVSKQSNVYKVFINGTQIGSNVTYATSINASTYDIGGTAGVSGPIKYMSNLRIVNGTAVYTANFTPPTTPLTAITNTSLLTCQSNNFKDNSSNNFTITRTGTPSVQPFSPFAPTSAYSTSVNGGSMYFDGTTDYLTTPTSLQLEFGTGDYTIEGWVYLNSVAATNKTLIGTGSTAASTNWQLSVDPSYPRFFYSANSVINGLSAPSLNTWTHLAATRSGTTVYFFVDGVLQGTATNSSNLTDSNAKIGVNRGSNSYLDGYISNLRILKGTALYTANFTPPTAPLTAVTNTQLLLNGTNAGIFDNAGKIDIETLDNARVSTAVVKYGTGSIYFDGTGDYLTFPPTPQVTFGTGNFTIECWINAPATQTSYAGIYCARTGGLCIIQFGNSGNGVEVWFGGQVASSSANLVANGWHHIAFVRLNGVCTIYVDGVAGSFSSTDNTNITTTSALIGVDGFNFPSRIFNGYIDDLRVTKGVARYTANFTPPTAAFPNS